MKKFESKLPFHKQFFIGTRAPGLRPLVLRRSAAPDRLINALAIVFIVIFAGMNE
ncbi:hypothetical protein [Legionella sp. MW5194]|uniref:hypothetical protein n=1 Tax=Legionella sp. MW5194 TaxID=2662448 RepID=UPI00193E760A|nr:hypothetical protein [Legionella sp. MW5194]